MAFLRRLLFYILGIGLGVLLVYAFFGDRDLDYAYGPGSRVKKILRTKAVDSTSLAQPELDLSRDSLYYQAVVNSKILFGESDPRKEPCGQYVLKTSLESYPYKITVENCDSLVRVLNVEQLRD